MLHASRKVYKGNENLRTRFNPETGQVELFAVKHIVAEVANPATEISLDEARALYGDEAEVDMEIEFPKPTDVLGRIAAQTAKQVIFQKVREAERETIYGEYSQRVGEVLNATVKRFEQGDIIVEIGPRRGRAPAQGTVPRRELQHRRPRARRDQGRVAQRQGAADHPVAHRPGPAHQAVRAGSAGDLRRHRR